MYIILNGSVSVLIKTANDSMICVKHLHDGDYFGELALINRKPRAATITTDQNCDFVVVTKKDYISIIKKTQEEALLAIYDFFSSIPLFSKWSKVAVSKLPHSFSLKSFTKGNTLYCEGEPAKNIFIIKEGEVEITSTIKTQSKKQINLTTQNSDQVISQLKMNKFGICPKGNLLSAITHCSVEIIKVGPYTIIGDEAFAESYKTFSYYTTATVCSLDAQIYACTVEV